MTEDEAKKRFFTLAAVRLVGVATAFLGVAILTKRFVEPADLIGGALIAFGIFDVIVMPLMLLRKWRAPKG